MGYILPIHHEQYAQYVNRSVPVKYQYQKVAGVQEIGLYSQYREPEKTFAFAQAAVKKAGKAMQKRRIFAEESRAQLLAQLTGKGRLINESV